MTLNPERSEQVSMKSDASVRKVVGGKLGGSERGGPGEVMQWAGSMMVEGRVRARGVSGDRKFRNPRVWEGGKKYGGGGGDALRGRPVRQPERPKDAAKAD